MCTFIVTPCIVKYVIILAWQDMLTMPRLSTDRITEYATATRMLHYYLWHILQPLCD